MEHYELERTLKETESLDIRPAYDGEQLTISTTEIRETDLLRDVKWIAVSEQVHGHIPQGNDEKVKSMV